MTDEKRYRTEIPNIIDDLGLDPYERTLYVHYKRVCGASGGQCTEGVRGTAEKTKMSQAKVSGVRSQLVKRGLIQMQPYGEVGGFAVTVIDIWPLNTAYYATKDRPNIDGWKVSQVEEWARGCSPGEHPLEELSPQEPNLNGHCSPGEQGCSGREQGCSPGEQKKELSKKELNNKLSPNGDSGEPPQQPEFSQPAFSEEFTLEPDTPETLLLFEKVNNNRKVEKRRPAKKFKSIEQKKKSLETANRLGYQDFEAGLITALGQGIKDLDHLVNWLAKYKPRKLEASASTRASPALTPEQQAAYEKLSREQ